MNTENVIFLKQNYHMALQNFKRSCHLDYFYYTGYTLFWWPSLEIQLCNFPTTVRQLPVNRV